MLKRMLSVALCLILLLGMATASAAPMLTSGGFTAYLGEGNHLFLRNPQGETRVLQFPIADILSITATDVYGLTQDGRLFSIRLDGTQTAVLSESPTDEEKAAVTDKPLFELADGVLSIVKTDGSKLQVAANVQAAAANGTHLFFIEAASTGATTLKSVPLTNLDALTAAPKATSLGMGVASPISMTATDDAVTIVCWDHSLTLFDLTNNQRLRFPALSDETMVAIGLGEQIFCYKQYANGTWVLENPGQTQPSAVEDLEDATAAPTASPAPTPTQKPTPAPTPTATAKPQEDDPYPRLKRGDTGDAVRRMQRRLKKLGYPVGDVDGDWGSKTQLAVNLFQFAIGYKERSYATSSMQAYLYSSKAPSYNRYKALRPGDEGTPVRLMQQALYRLGYLDSSSEIDGIYGSTTKGAVRAFQEAVGSPLSPTGKADSDTLIILFSKNAPAKPQVTDPNYPEFITPAPTQTTDPDDAEQIAPPPTTDTPETDTPDQPAPPTDPNYPELILPPAKDPEDAGDNPADDQFDAGDTEDPEDPEDPENPDQPAPPTDPNYPELILPGNR